MNYVVTLNIVKRCCELAGMGVHSIVHIGWNDAEVTFTHNGQEYDFKFCDLDTMEIRDITNQAKSVIDQIDQHIILSALDRKKRACNLYVR